MQYSTFIDRVKSHGNMKSDEQAMTVTRATLETLEQRITGNEPHDLASQLPEEFKPYLKGQGSGERFDIDEFYRRVASLANISDSNVAKQQTKAVMTTVAEAVSGGELDDLKSQLPDDFSVLFQTMQ